MNGRTATKTTPIANKGYEITKRHSFVIVVMVMMMMVMISMMDWDPKCTGSQPSSIHQQLNKQGHSTGTDIGSIELGIKTMIGSIELGI